MLRERTIPALASLCAAVIGMLCAACIGEDEPAPAAGRSNVTVQVSVDTRDVGEADGAVTEDPTADEAALHSLRVYAYAGGNLIGYYGISNDVSAPHTFYMDLTMTSAADEEVTFYVVANEAAMVNSTGIAVSLTETTTEAELNSISFTGLNSVAGNGLPMCCKQTETIDFSQDADTNPNTAPGHEGHTLLNKNLEFSLERPFGKLGVFAAAPADDNVPVTLTITGLTLLKGGPRTSNYLMPQDAAALQSVTATDADITLTPVSGEVTARLSATDDKTDPENYTEVLAEPCYLFENPYGSTVWDTKGDDGGNILRIDYTVAGKQSFGLVYLPKIERNNYYQVMCLISAGVTSITYASVKAWDEKENNVTFN